MMFKPKSMPPLIPTYHHPPPQVQQRLDVKSYSQEQITLDDEHKIVTEEHKHDQPELEQELLNEILGNVK